MKGEDERRFRQCICWKAWLSRSMTAAPTCFECGTKPASQVDQDSQPRSTNRSSKRYSRCRIPLQRNTMTNSTWEMQTSTRNRLVWNQMTSMPVARVHIHLETIPRLYRASLSLGEDGIFCSRCNEYQWKRKKNHNRRKYIFSSTPSIDYPGDVFFMLLFSVQNRVVGLLS